VPAQLGESDILEFFTTLNNAGRWGPDDEVGTVNLITPQTVLEAARLIETGETVSCALQFGKGLAAGSFDHKDPGLINFTSYMVVSGEHWQAQEPGVVQHVMEYIAQTIHGQNYTHLDALCHIFYDGKGYNNRNANIVTEMEGATELGIEVWRKGIVSRGVLLDIRSVREPNGAAGIDDLVYLEDFLAAEEKEGVSVREGDIVIHRTGIESGLARRGFVGIHPEVLSFYHERGVAVIAGDTAHDQLPTHRLWDSLAQPVHQVAHAAMGLAMLDNVAVDELADACRRHDRYAFHLSMGPLPMVGGTGSMVNPIATF
jgi:kynurenine formamidase